VTVAHWQDGSPGLTQRDPAPAGTGVAAGTGSESSLRRGSAAAYSESLRLAAASESTVR